MILIFYTSAVNREVTATLRLDHVGTANRIGLVLACIPSLGLKMCYKPELK